MQPSVKTELFHPAHQDALTQDLEVLEQLLISNRAAQSRTKYFQRLEMSCRCIRKKELLGVFEAYQTLSRDVAEQVVRKRNQKKREKVFWEFTSKKDTSGSENSQEEMQLIARLTDIRKRLEIDIPEAVSRIEYASEALFREMARGFFLTFCSVGVAAIARIRVLLQRLGSQILHEWPSWEKNFVECFGQPSIRSAVEWESGKFNELQDKFHPPKMSKGDNDAEMQHLLHDLGVSVAPTVAANEGETSKPTHLLESAGDKSSVMTGEEESSELDLGEQLTSQTTANENEIEPDYMDTAISRVQTDLARARRVKSNVARNPAKVKLSKKAAEAPRERDEPSPSFKKTSELPGIQGEPLPSSKGSNNFVVEVVEKKGPSSDSPPGEQQKKKKKKRKDGSNPKSAKKAKPKCDFFDKLFH